MDKKIKDIKTYGDLEDVLNAIEEKYGESFKFKGKEYNCYPKSCLYCPTTGEENNLEDVMKIYKTC